MHRLTGKVERRDYPCWAIIQPASDIPGKWVAHCLVFDTLAQADDPEVAYALLLQSTSEIVLEDLRAGMDPLDRRAPQDDEGWSLLRFVTEEPDSTSTGALTPDLWTEIRTQTAAGHPQIIAIQFFLGYQRAVASSHLASAEATQTLFQTRQRDLVAIAI
jgi:hypothetical protein